MSKPADKQKALFIQLPFTSQSSWRESENPRLAAAYLISSAKRSSESGLWNFHVAPADLDRRDDAGIMAWIIRRRPDVICATLYLWNIERTLSLLAKIRLALPGVRIMTGGPEVAHDHPFLFSEGLVDMAVTGDGEAVFPHLLGCCRTGSAPSYDNVIFRSGRKYRTGAKAADISALKDILPDVRHPLMQPDAKGIAYLETGRACPYGCTFCRYSRARRKVSFIGASEVVSRVSAMISMGAREIRFVDPSMNVNPDFELILEGIARINRPRRVTFFAEVLAERISRQQAGMLKRAGFTMLESGVQSTDTVVLKNVKRPADPGRVHEGILNMAAAGLGQTIDLMCGLPGQSPAEVRKSVRLYSKVPRGKVQLLHTLLIPGSELRSSSSRLGIQYMPLPPYRVLRTPMMGPEDLMRADSFYESVTGLCLDEEMLPGVIWNMKNLYPDRSVVSSEESARKAIAGRGTSHRALIFRFRDPWLSRSIIAKAISDSIHAEPHIMWQFVIEARSEFPVDLIESLVGLIRESGSAFADRMASRGERIDSVARRLFVCPVKRSGFSSSWRLMVSELLG